jgi:acetyltransferase-like isoleucine patch superfamily enzyme
VISGFCEIGEYSFMGVNATVSNNISIGNNCTVGAGAIIVGDIPDNKTVIGLWKRDKKR